MERPLSNILLHAWMGSELVLQRISDRNYEPADGEVPVVCVVRNEIDILPDFLEHYRGIGVRDFLFVDNGSTDGTREMLLAQPDCVVFHTAADYSAARSGIDWAEHVLRTHCRGRWAILADCDEHLHYPTMDRRSIAAFAASLAAEGHDSCHAILVDMYTDAPLGSFDLARRDVPLKTLMDCFDRDYHVRRLPARPGRRLRRPLQVIGGPRCRLLSSFERELRHGWAHATLIGQIDRLVHRVPSSWLPLLFRHWPPALPAQHKQPLNFVHEGTRFLNAHDGTNQRVAPVMLCQLHYKFCKELDARRRTKAIDERYYRRGLEREQLRLAVARWPHPTLLYEGTLRFRSHHDLVSAGLLGGRFAEALAFYREDRSLVLDAPPCA